MRPSPPSPRFGTHAVADPGLRYTDENAPASFHIGVISLRAFLTVTWQGCLSVTLPLARFWLFHYQQSVGRTDEPGVLPRMSKARTGNEAGEEGAQVVEGAKSLSSMRKAHVERVLGFVENDIEKAAPLLGISPAELRRWMTRLEIR